MLTKIDHNYFEVIKDDQQSFNEEQFTSRYSEILDKYDFIVGDFGYDQLRLKGFYYDSNKKSDSNKRFSAIQDYLLEYCNFGCKYFVLRRLTKAEITRLTAEDAHFVDEDNKLDDVKIEPTIQQNSKQEEHKQQENEEEEETVEEEIVEEQQTSKNTLKDYL
ncbi:YutD family protein [Mammaliicoccus vitulinus]|nr:YutD family protein [Mammaliicoccus vitulinus]QJF24578.1 YutD family protein [Mammaliicoccus vitulinus]